MKVIGLVGLTLLMAGCGSVDSRIMRNQDVFAQLDAAEQQRLRDQIVSLGDSPEMVLIAYGKPDETSSITTSGGRTRTVWTYHGKYYRKTGLRIQAPIYGEVPMPDEYQAFDFVLAEVTFLDEAVVHLRDPAAEARAQQAIEEALPPSPLADN
jgi:hypothetical protein